MDKFTKILPPLVDGFSANILAYAVLLASIATITIALLELVKAVFKLRLVYQKRMVKRWINKKLPTSNTAYEQLIILSVSDIDSANALFDQPSEKMMGE